jgi:hypothetical protein
LSLEPLSLLGNKKVRPAASDTSPINLVTAMRLIASHLQQVTNRNIAYIARVNVPLLREPRKEKAIVQKATKVFSPILLGVLLASMSIAVYADLQVSVLLLDPVSHGAKGLYSGDYHVGELAINVSKDTAPWEQTFAYCMNFDKKNTDGDTYEATLATVMENAEWRAVSYILTWYHPPANNSEAAANQVAIWRLLNITRGYNYLRPDWLSATLDDAGNALANIANGKDVVRQGDLFQWIEPITANQSAVMGDVGKTITFKAKLTNATGAPRANVKILFSAILRPNNVTLNSTHVYPSEAYTDSNGIVEVTVKAPSDILNGASIEVKASTKSVWPQLYLDLDDSRRQDLIGIGTTYELTVATNVCLLAHISVIPEVPFGTLTAGTACAFAFALWTKGSRLKKQKIK